MCENCINKDVCKYYNSVTECENTIEEKISTNIIKIKFECEKRRENA